MEALADTDAQGMSAKEWSKLNKAFKAGESTLAGTKVVQVQVEGKTLGTAKASKGKAKASKAKASKAKASKAKAGKADGSSVKT
eukprot:7832079-Pyramimonas_sp.AAC.1